MIDLGSVHIDIGEGIPLEDFVNHPEEHHWEVNFEFPYDEIRDPKATPTGKKYGTAIDFDRLYGIFRDMGMPFIDRYFYNEYQDSDVKAKGDELLYELNDYIGIQVENVNNRDNEIYSMSKNVRTNQTRLDNARERYEDYRQAIDDMRYDIEYLEDNLVRTKSGSYDRRYGAYREYLDKQERLGYMYDELDRLERRVEIEETRLDNSIERQLDAVEELRAIQNGLEGRLLGKYETMAEDFANMIKDDIISKAKNGTLPMQRLPLAEGTIKNRLKAGLRRYPRFWATGQLVSPIIITCTLV